MIKNFKLIEKDENIIVFSNKMSIWVANDLSENNFKYLKVYDKNPILNKDAIPAYVDLLCPRYLPIKRKK